MHFEAVSVDRPCRRTQSSVASAVQAAMKLTEEQKCNVIALYEQCLAGINSAMLRNDAVLAAISGPSPSDPGPPPAVIGGSLVS